MIRKIANIMSKVILISSFVLMEFSKVCAVKINGVEFVEVIYFRNVEYGIENKGDHFEATVLSANAYLCEDTIRPDGFGEDVMIT
jgi:hypothetical protein